MLRIAVTAYLTFVAFIGPGLCCCTAIRLADGTHCRQSRQHEHKSRSCCHSKPVSDDGQRPSQNDQRPHCPCNDHRSTPIALVASEVLVANVFTLGQAVGFMVPIAVLDGGLPIVAGSLFAPVPGDDGVLFGRDILRAFQILRC